MSKTSLVTRCRGALFLLIALLLLIRWGDALAREYATGLVLQQSVISGTEPGLMRTARFNLVALGGEPMIGQSSGGGWTLSGGYPLAELALQRERSYLPLLSVSR